MGRPVPDPSSSDVAAQIRLVFPSISPWAIAELESLYPSSSFASTRDRYESMSHHYDMGSKLFPVAKAYARRSYHYINYLGNAK
jgi:hypothetical protein